MILRLFVLLILIVGYSCENKKEGTNTTIIDVDSTKKMIDVQEHREAKLDEFFVDSTKIGVPRKNKLEINQIRTTDSVYAVIKFFSKQSKKWLLKDSIIFLKDGITGLEALVLDYNNDGLGDFTFRSSIAGRGANEIRTLFIHSKQKNQLIHIKNSEEYANLQYNKELKCVDAFNVWGGSISYFLNIVEDSLKPFASVELYEGLTVTEYDKKGKETIIHSDTSVKYSYGRYKSYNPLIEYEDY